LGNVILAINTSTPQFSVALVYESGALLAEWTLSPKTKDFRHFMTALDHLLQVSGVTLKEIRGLAVAKGPGSFTGLRVGLSAAKGICEGLGVPIVALSSLEALAGPCSFQPYPVCPLIDSRKEEVFAALYTWSEKQELVRLEPETCLKIWELPGFIKKRAFVLGRTSIASWGLSLRRQETRRSLPLPLFGTSERPPWGCWAQGKQELKSLTASGMWRLPI